MANGTNGNVNGGGSRRTWITVAVIIAIVLLVSSFMSLRPKRIRVSTARPERIDISSTITTNGKVEPTRNFEAHASSPSRVRQLLAREGQQVKAGQLLVELDDADARAQLAKAMAQLRAAEAGGYAIQQGGTNEEILTRQADSAKAQSEYSSASRNLDALQRLQGKGAASPEEVAAARERLNRAQADLNLLQQKDGKRFSTQERTKAQADVEQARASVAAAQEAVAACNIRAPFDGTLYSLPVRQGSWVNVGDLILQMADLSNMQVRAFVDEPEIGRLAKDQAVRIAWDALPGRTWEGRVQTIPTTVVTRGSRTVGEMICDVQNTDGRLLPNINVNATIVTAARPGALTIPREALKDDNGKPAVYVLKNNRLEQRAVQTGVANLTRIEITKGISADDIIAIQSLSPLPLSNGIGVKVVENP